MWKTKISHILELYDGYTGQPADAGQFRIESSLGKVVWMPKDNGCMVLCDCGKTDIKISLESRWYLKKQVFLGKALPDGKRLVQRVWVFPGDAYPQQKWEVLKHQEAQPLCQAVIFPVAERRTFRLYQNVKKQDTCLWIYHKKHEHLEGREILLYPQQMRLVLGKETTPFCFLLEHPIEIETEIKKDGTQIVIGYEGAVREDGSLQIAVPIKTGSVEKSILYIEGQRQEIVHDCNKEV